MSDIEHPLKVFLCHSHSDKDTVKALYDRLVKDGVDAWLDKENLLPGQNWRIEIQKAVRSADVVMVCHSKEFNREGFKQREVKWALDAAMEKPEGEIFVIPARLEECEVLDSLSEWQWVDLFEPNGYERLIKALRARAESVGATLHAKKSRKPRTSPAPVKAESHIEKENIPATPLEKPPVEVGRPAASGPVTESPARAPEKLPVHETTSTGRVDIPEVPAKRAGRPYKLRMAYVVAIIGAAATIIAALLGSPFIGKWFSPVPLPTTTETIQVQASLTDEITDPKGVKMVLVAAGEFTMGSDDGYTDEQPPHTVFLDPYYIDKYEVTSALYKACVDTGPCDVPIDPKYYNDPQYAEHPVVYVDWNMAKEYCEWRGARLPTEAEWEKAARGMDGRTYPWGEGIDCTYANYKGKGNDYCVGDTVAVGSYASGKGPYGTYDMAGNVWQWVADWYGESYYASSPEQNPPGPESGDFRVLRGGSWRSLDLDLRSAGRFRLNPSNTYYNIGFRCSRSP